MKPVLAEKEKIDVLVVDDREDGLIALEAVLNSPELNIVTALSGAEALALLPRYDFAVILLDVQMPGMDGFETAEHIKRQERFKHVPIVFVTAISSEERYVFRGYETGAVDYISKPFEPYVLKSKVSVFVSLHRQAKLIQEQNRRLRDIDRHERLRHLAELELESLRRYRGLADAVPHIVFHASADGVVSYFNQLWNVVTGLRSEINSVDGWHAAFNKEDLQNFLRVWLGAMQTGERFQAECRIFCQQPEVAQEHPLKPSLAPGKTERWHLVLGVPEKKSDGTVTAWICTATDIDDRRQVEEECRRAKVLADSANAAKTQFLANMSHEIRTPLSAILGFSELMMNPSQSVGDRIQAATTIRRNGEQLLNIINEILDISKVEAGKLEIEEVPTDLLTLLTELRSLFELHASERGLIFKIAVQPGHGQLPRQIRTDPTRLRQILINIVGNAIKFTTAGSITVTLDFQNSAGPRSKLIIRVEDTGVGISEEGRLRLFKPFTQVDNSTSRRFGGTGLGLALSKQLAQALGGDVRILSSELGRGSVFEISIGVGDDGDSARQGPWIDSGVLPAPTVSVSNRKVDEPLALRGARILLVEDATDNQVLISRYLTIAGGEVEVASNGLEGVEKVEANSYDVILMDIQMPVLDGYAATQRLRASGYTKPIIALTAHALNSERAKCLAAGFDDHLPKPVDRRNLIARVKGHCQPALFEIGKPDRRSSESRV